MVGSSVTKKFIDSNYNNLIFEDSKKLDLRNQEAVNKFISKQKPDAVIICAAKVGGILANNKYRGDFIYDNVMIASNLIHSSYLNNVKKLIFLGSSCIYPKLSKQPIKEEYLLSDLLEYTNEPYAIAKIAGIKLCENYYKQYGCNFISLMPTNLFGYNDNFDLKNSHVLPALLRKFHDAKNNSKEFVEVWGSGEAKREFMFVDDFSDAIKFIFENIDAKDIFDLGLSHINIGTGKDISIKELADIIKKIIGFNGKIVFDKTKPDGTPRKLLNIDRVVKFGWTPTTNLVEDIKKTYTWFEENNS